MLTSGNEEMKIVAMFQLVKLDDNVFNKKEFSEIISGILRLLMRKPEKLINNSRIFAEEITNKLFSKFNENEAKSDLSIDEFKKWVYKEEYKNKMNNSVVNSNNVVKNSDISSKSTLSVYVESVIINEKLMNIDSIISKIALYLKNINQTYFFDHVNVLEAVKIFKKNSLLGILNKTQIIQCFKDIFSIVRNKFKLNFNDVSYNLIKDICSKLFNLIENKNDFYSLVEVFTGFSILFHGTKVKD